jgi:Co/Zn/Cd efflux system component
VAFALTYRNIALRGSYMASSFVASSDGHSRTLISEAAHALSQTASLTQAVRQLP